MSQKSEHPVLDPMKIWASLRVARAFENADNFLPVFQFVEQLTDPFEVARRQLSSMKFAWPRTIRTGRLGMILAPIRESLGDEFRGRGPFIVFLAFADFGPESRFRLGDVSPIGRH